ncbi:MBL fold metallo-hydrolase [Daejeonella oryzae]|uniref:MBL fold metallo-hydrolase n=1 Tax=Daejeonella oryzae TaxID=1122943 RepID=UPI00042281C9|nr:MBL fold metallo-hydrolase [Daejeonella oryzae]
MSLYITSLNSGSNGNCYYIGNKTDAVLIDAGISCREIEKRMLRLGLSMSNLKAVFISHEHSDHIRGVSILAKKYNLPIYISSGTLAGMSNLIEDSLVKVFNGFDEIKIGELKITAFPKIHDASDPHSFIITFENINIGVFTDLGSVCKNLITYFKQCHAAFLEANYDEELLNSGNYPYYLKNRIRGGNGHLSNHQALELFKTHKPRHMSHLLLSHLSKDNNCPELVQSLFSKQCSETKIIVASRFVETPVYLIEAKNSTDYIFPITLKPLQLSLFD